jgi:hypothetical protein
LGKEIVHDPDTYILEILGTEITNVLTFPDARLSVSTP